MQNPKGCWRQCISAALAIFCTIGLNVNGFSVYIPYLKELLQLTFNQSSSFLTVRNLFSVAGVFAAKYYYEKLDIRLGYLLVLLLNVVALYLFSIAPNFGMICIAASLSGITYGLGGIYPAALLIHRWFPRHEGLAMGFCAASSGLAITVAAPIITRLTENFSMQYAMNCEMVFLLACLVICFCLTRNYPAGTMHFITHHHTKIHPLRLNGMVLAIISIGVMGGAFSYLTIHYTTEGFDPYKVSNIVSIIGIVLTGAKFILGELFDRIGAYKTNWIFLILAIISCFCFAIGATAGYTIALIAAVLYGIGDAVATVGITAYARDLSRPEKYADTQQQYQTACLIGGLISTFLPGPIATFTGNYRLYFLVITVLMVFATFVIQFTYRKKMQTK